jgi:hypothetical protein
VMVAPQPVEPGSAFTLVLRNGRRIVSRWNYRDTDIVAFDTPAWPTSNTHSAHMDSARLQGASEPPPGN